MTKKKHETFRTHTLRLTFLPTKKANEVIVSNKMNIRKIQNALLIICFGWNYSIRRRWHQLTDDSFCWCCCCLQLLLLLPTSSQVIFWAVWLSNGTHTLTQVLCNTHHPNAHVNTRSNAYLPLGCQCFAALQSSQATTTAATISSTVIFSVRTVCFSLSLDYIHSGITMHNNWKAKESISEHIAKIVMHIVHCCHRHQHCLCCWL